LAQPPVQRRLDQVNGSRMMEGLSMRPWIIVLSSAILAVSVAAVTAVPEVLNAPPAEILPILLAHTPALAVAALAVYALLAMLMVTASVLAGALRARHDLGAGQRERIVAPSADGFGQLAARLVPVLSKPGPEEAGIALRTPFALREARRVVARLHYISLARSHFFSAMIVLLGMIALGLAQNHGSLPFSAGTVPTISAILVFVGLVLLTLLGRIAIDVTVEPLFETISQLPAEHAEFHLLRRAVDALETACRTGATLPLAQIQFPERLAVAVEDGHRAVLDAVNRLSENTRSLEAVMQSSIDSIETAARTAVDHDKIAADAAGFSELKGAVEQLTAVIQHIAALPRQVEERAPVADPNAPRRKALPPLAGELRNLLQEIGAD
jgi:hypothetical protein